LVYVVDLLCQIQQKYVCICQLLVIKTNFCNCVAEEVPKHEKICRQNYFYCLHLCHCISMSYAPNSRQVTKHFLFNLLKTVYITLKGWQRNETAVDADRFIHY
jgi:hypothetical protein